MKQKKAKKVVESISIFGYFQSLGFAILFAFFIAFIFNLIFKEEFLVLLIVAILVLGTTIFGVIVFDNLRKCKEWARKIVIFLEFFGVLFLLGIMVLLAVEIGPQGFSLTTAIIFTIIMALFFLIISISITMSMLNKDVKKLFKRKS